MNPANVPAFTAEIIGYEELHDIGMRMENYDENSADNQSDDSSGSSSSSNESEVYSDNEVKKKNKKRTSVSAKHSSEIVNGSQSTDESASKKNKRIGKIGKQQQQQSTVDSESEKAASENESPPKKSKTSKKLQKGSSKECDDIESFNWKINKGAPVKVLLDFRGQYHSKFENPRMKKISLWNKIAAKMSKDPHRYKLTGPLAKRKWDNLYSTYKQHKAKSGKTGRGAGKTWEYFEEMDRIVGTKSSIVPQPGLIASTFTDNVEEFEMENNNAQASSSSIKSASTSSETKTTDSSQTDKDDGELKHSRLPLWLQHFTGKMEKKQNEMLQKFEEKEKQKMDELKEIETTKINLLKDLIENMKNQKY